MCWSSSRRIPDRAPLEASTGLEDFLVEFAAPRSTRGRRTGTGPRATSLRTGAMPVTQYLLSIVQPDGPPPPPAQLEKIMSAVGAVMKELKGAGAWVFNGGLHPAHDATVVRVQ